MKINKKYLLISYLNTKELNFRKTFEDIFVLYYDISRNEYYREIENFFLTKKELFFLIDLTNKQLINEDITFALGFKWFLNNKIKIKKGIFVPQSDSEKFVEIIAQENSSGQFLEVGTGSGALAIALYNLSLGKYQIDAIDFSKKAIKLAKTNFFYNKRYLENIVFFKKDIRKLSTVKKYDVIFSNPPYLKKNDQEISSWVRKNQPVEALFPPGGNSLYYYEFLFKNAFKWLKSNGKLYLEFGFNQKEEIERLLSTKFKNLKYQFYKDLNNIDRYLKIANF